MIDSQQLLNELKRQVTALEDDLRERCDTVAEVDAPLRAQYDAAKGRKRTALTYKAWREEELTQVAVAWVLGCVFVRFLEDNELVETPKLAGPGDRLRRARDEHELFFRKRPTDTEREYLQEVFAEAGQLPGMKDFFAKKHNPFWLAAPSGDACRELWQFWQKTDPETGALRHDFTDPEWNTRFLGDLYQDLSAAARKSYALLQTPEFVEEFILDRTLTPAIQTFGYQVARLIDPTCGSGHFLLGAFARFFRLWQEECPGENPRVLAQRALDGVYGVDLNPFAVAIARFRLLLAALAVSGVKRLKEAPDFQIHLAVGDSLLHGRRFRNEFESNAGPQRTFDTGEEVFRDELAHHYEVEDGEALHRILGQQYHAVVGNPPYITVKDKALNQLYRDRYDSCHRKYALSVPFMERFFDIALTGSSDGRNPGGFTGQITSNSFMKREFGKKIIEEKIPQWDLSHVLDTSGAYIPGHGTPTVILFGRNTKPTTTTIRTVMGIRGEPATPDEPAKGQVWSAICEQIDQPGSESEFVSVADTERDKFYKHPWSIGGGGATELQAALENAGQYSLSKEVIAIGFGAILGEDDAFGRNPLSHSLSQLPEEYRRPLIEGDKVRDWDLDSRTELLFPYTKTVELAPLSNFANFIWPNRSLMEGRRDFSKRSYKECGRPFWEYHQIPVERNCVPLSITFAFVATHNHFVLDRGGKVFNRSAPVIKLPADASEDDHLRLLGLLNSAVACFWMQQVFHNKGGPGGGSSKDEKWHDFFEFDGTKLKQFPIPAGSPLVFAKALDRLAREISTYSPGALASRDAVTADALAGAEEIADKLRGRMISLQEELDWQCYRFYGLVEPKDELEWAEDRLDELPPLTLGHRAFEIFMARQIAGGQLETKWFSRLGAIQTTELPEHWPANYRALVERRLAVIDSNKNIGLIERTNFKRRWNTEPWAKRQQEALRKWLLARLEAYFFEGDRVCDLKETFDPTAHGFTAADRPHLVSVNQLSDVVQSDPTFLAAAEVYTGASGSSVPKLVRELVEAEAVPFLPVHRYKPGGLRKRQDWEETWALQRKEDAVEAEVRRKEEGKTEAELKKLVREAQQEVVGDIPVPPKYGSGDFTKTTFWKLRGKLDVPKERWISYPGAERAGDDSLVIAWAGWNHLQQAQALAEYFLDAKENQGWPPERLKPLLAGLADLIPWLKQWHNDIDPDYGTGLGDYFAGFLEEQCRALGFAVEEVETMRFEDMGGGAEARPAKGSRRRGRAKRVSVPEPAGHGDDLRVDAGGGYWMDQPFALLAPDRRKLTDYRMLVWPELLRQMPGEMEFETFRKAYWLLSEPGELERLGGAIVPNVPSEWWKSRSERLAKKDFLDTLKGSVALGEVKIWKKDGVRLIQWCGSADPSDYPETVDDARIALQVAGQWTDEVVDAEREAIEHELALLEA